MKELKQLLQHHLQTAEGKASVAELSDSMSFGILLAVLKALDDVADMLPEDEQVVLRRALKRITPPKQ